MRVAVSVCRVCFLHRIVSDQKLGANLKTPSAFCREASRVLPFFAREQTVDAFGAPRSMGDRQQMKATVVAHSSFALRVKDSVNGQEIVRNV